MTDTTAGRALVTRSFGWIVLAVMGAFLVDSILKFWLGFPGAAAALSGGGALALLQAALYPAAAALAVLGVTRRPEVSLRDDAARVTAINTFIVRAAFWVVVLVGIGDAILSFLRVDGLLEGLVGTELASDLGRSQFRGIYFHLPLVLLGILIAAVTRGIAFVWLGLLVVLAELLIVFSRFVFSYEQAFMADLVRFWYGALFLFASAYTLLEDAHVRVDLLYSNMSRRAQGRTNAWGAVLLGITLCWTILIIGFGSSSSIIVGPILVFEVTQSGFGMYVKYFMAAFLGIFAVTMMFQFVAQFFEAVADRRGEPGARESHAEMI
ncbi:TRAP-type mannitol/chloroaromatic compound transport system permease small subunit [Rhodovulum iodosum]|uniref:TRAP transporter small permease protein n=1 Tax=Rhodovulum iodosum TaxID=68291 RepID=A0ABV3XW37_9RHOB|nr:TRAP transporter small permease subunit [Rhodovulum robiginosum]RSK36722.1 TRAP transporter small permease subunit [Rhodovulum robiginosum]